MDRGRFSYMGAQGGPLWRAITYHLPALDDCTSTTNNTTTEHQTLTGAASTPPLAGLLPLADVALSCLQAGSGAGTVYVQDKFGQVVNGCLPFFSYLRQLLATHQLLISEDAAEQLPFNFWGGLVGYLGYELKAECGGAAVHAAHTPDAGLLFVDRFLAIDHVTGDVFLLAIYDQRHTLGTFLPLEAQDSYIQAQTWLDDMQHRMLTLIGSAALPDVPVVVCSNGNGSTGAAGLVSPACVCGHAGKMCSDPDQEQALSGKQVVVPDRTLRLRHPKPQYLKNIASCISALYAGESYEVCLTTALVRQGTPPPHLLYKTLRTLNPAPYGAWLHLGNAGPTICCSSPERFLRGDRGGVLEARPIKGTAARRIGDPMADAAAAAELAGSEKDRAENLMIVDLLRNDLGAVCEVGSVHVPGLMEIESYATVHQMVSTVRGLRRRDASLVDALQAAFPAGSMTGAPKVRTMAIIDTLEGGARGVYSGSIGFISLNDCFDLNVVIRTAVIDRGSTLTTLPTDINKHTVDDQQVTDSKESYNQVLAVGGEQQCMAVGGARLDGDGRGQRAGPVWKGLDEAVMSIGAGGAIVVQSELEGEFAEMRLKARALLAAIGICDGEPSPAVLDDMDAWSGVGDGN